MRIAILYICTGRYSIFWKDFYESCEQHFMPDTEKEYFVFTDSDTIEHQDNPSVHKIFQKSLGWPDNTLMRYHMFAAQKEKLTQFDFVFFFNANIIFIDRINPDEVLPAEHENFIACLHPGFYQKSPSSFPYEKNKKSKAYLPTGTQYVQGAMNGGRGESFVSMLSAICKDIDQDKEHGIVSAWQDESYWNAFIERNREKTKILLPSYLYPEDWELDLVPKIIILDKKRFGGHAAMRNRKELRLILNETKHVVKDFLLSLTRPVARISGGLGNQMFQYATIYAVSQKQKRKPLLDLSSYYHRNKKDTLRYFDLMDFRISHARHTQTNFFPFSLFIARILVNIFPKNTFAYDEKILGKKYLNGIYPNLQNEKYFSEFKDELMKQFRLKKESADFRTARQELSSATCVSMHIRRGDYVSNSNYVSLDAGYFKEAYDQVTRKIGTDFVLIIFSDDPTWAKENITFHDNIRILSGSGFTAAEELMLMSCCTHNIISNSTFSWWGAWLNANPNKIVIAPKRWFTLYSSVEIDILPPTWIQV